MGVRGGLGASVGGPSQGEDQAADFQSSLPFGCWKRHNMRWVRGAREGGIPAVKVQELCGRDAGRILVLGMRHLDGEVGPFSICPEALFLIPRPPRPVDMPSQLCLWTGRGAG